MIQANEIKTYHNLICTIPNFLIKYLTISSLERLKNIGYFCGMDFASTDIYNFAFYISRFDHSLSTALITWRFTNDKMQTIAALFHDISTPCFSHVIDYMNKDYVNQESTEEKTEEILFQDEKLIKLLKEDNLDITEIINFKNYSIVDNNRPKLCADRIDGILLTSFAWTKKLTIEESNDILNDMEIFENEDGEMELGFRALEIVKKVQELNNFIDEYCHSNFDNYMMILLSELTKYCLDNNLFSYDELYTFTELDVLEIFNERSLKDNYFNEKFNEFQNKKSENIPVTKLPKVKKRIICPLLNGIRM